MNENPFVETTIRVRYAETDQMKVVHHAVYLVWFEYARTEFCRKYGVEYSRMEADGLFLPVVEARIRYRQAARYDDDLMVRAEVTSRTRRTLHLKYTVSRDGLTLADGETTQMLVDSESRPRSFPPEVARRFDGDPG